MNVFATRGLLVKPNITRIGRPAGGESGGRGHPGDDHFDDARLRSSSGRRGRDGPPARTRGIRHRRQDGNGPEVRPGDRAYSSRMHLASFVGFVPAERPGSVDDRRPRRAPGPACNTAARWPLPSSGRSRPASSATSAPSRSRAGPLSSRRGWRKRAGHETPRRSQGLRVLSSDATGDGDPRHRLFVQGRPAGLPLRRPEGREERRHGFRRRSRSERRRRRPLRMAQARRPPSPLDPGRRRPGIDGPRRRQLLRPSVDEAEGRRRHRDQGKDDDDLHPRGDPEDRRASSPPSSGPSTTAAPDSGSRPPGRRPKPPTSRGCSPRWSRPAPPTA